MRKLLFIPFLIGIVLSYSSCNFGGGGNVVGLPPTYAVVDYNPNLGGTIVRTEYGYYSVPTLYDVATDDCLFMRFSIDYDNQPYVPNYYIASDIEKISVNRSYLEMNPLELEDYTLPITRFDMFSLPIYDGRVFFEVETKGKTSNFRLVYDTKEEDEIIGVKNLYLLARSESSPGSSQVVTQHAFDIRNLFDSFSRDTTLIQSGVTYDLKYIKTNIKYISNMVDGEPKYESLTNPVNIYIFKNQ